jgi:hypothetical protein
LVVPLQMRVAAASASADTRGERTGTKIRRNEGPSPTSGISVSGMAASSSYDADIRRTSRGGTLDRFLPKERAASSESADAAAKRRLNSSHAARRTINTRAIRPEGGGPSELPRPELPCSPEYR